MSATPRRWLRPRRIILAVLAASLLASYLARRQVLPVLAHFLDVSESPHPVSAVMVLGGGANDRPFVAAALVRVGLTERVLVPTVKLSPENEDGLIPPEHELIRRALLKRDLPADCIVQLPGECASTQDEARALFSYLEKHPEATVAVVTHAFHTRRARLLFHRVLGAKAAQVSFVAVPSEQFSAEDWWQSEEGFVTYSVEYAKLVMYELR